MAREVVLTSKTTGVHHLQVGFNNNELGSFSWQLWITKYGIRAIDWAQAMGLGFITFMGGDVWVHNRTDVSRCFLYGEKRDCVVGVVSNEKGNIIKVYDSVGIHTNAQWEIEEITIPASLNFPQGMYSKLPKERFKKRDGVWRAEFLRNMMTNSTTASVIQAINGEPLRGHYIYMKLKNIDDGQVKLFKVDVSSTLSKI